MGLKDVITEAQRIAQATADDANRSIAGGDLREAKRIVTSGQRELREFKRQIADAERETRAEFAEQRNKIGKSGQVIGAFAGSKARGAMARGRAMDKRRLADRQQAITNDYRRAKATIDGLVAQLGDAKFKIDGEISRGAQQPKPAKAAKPQASLPAAVKSSPPPPPPTPPTWAADPFGRFELRYWDGVRWTEHVSNAGVQSTDPPAD